MNKNLLLIVTALGIAMMSCASSASITTSKSAILEVYQFGSLDSLMSDQPRPVTVFMHAPWCQFCKNMEQTTLADKKIITLLNEEYYFVSFDGEQKEDVQFRDYNFQYQPTGRNSGTHELAKSLASIDGELTYPSVIILDSDYEIVFQHGAFLDSEEMMTVLEEGLKAK